MERVDEADEDVHADDNRQDEESKDSATEEWINILHINIMLR